MVKFHESSYAHPHPFETVTLAYFLRYPNPYSTHVLSTDVVSRHFDPETQTLHTARLHLKRSKVPKAILALIPKSWLGSTDGGGTSQSHILERSIVDIRSGVMITESRNLELTGVLKVVERQLYRRPGTDLSNFFGRVYDQRRPTSPDSSNPGVFRLPTPAWQGEDVRVGADQAETQVLTKVELISNLGEGPRRLWNRAKGAATSEMNSQQEQEQQQSTPPQKMGFFRSWSTSSVQRSIEAIGLRRTERAVPNSKKGMNVVLDRLRTGGLVAVFEGMKHDRETSEVLFAQS